MHAPTDDHLAILAAIRHIPCGRVCSYGAIAALAELPGRARLVGFVLRTSPLADDVPWYRVVNAQGHLSTRGNARHAQRRHLVGEGVTFVGPARVDLARHGWQPDSIEP